MALSKSATSVSRHVARKAARNVHQPLDDSLVDELCDMHQHEHVRGATATNHGVRFDLVARESNYLEFEPNHRHMFPYICYNA